MHRIRLGFLTCLLWEVCAAGVASGAPAIDAKTKAIEEAAIRQQLVAYAAARSNGDGNLQASFYTEDADEWGSSEREMTVGREAIAKRVALPPDPNRKMRLEVLRIDFLTPAIALVNCTYGGTSQDPTGKVLYVMMKTNGKWLIRSNRPSRFPGK
jgi:ketosteroid isomerase-like protein